MKCPYCEKEMERGSVSFLAAQGFAQMILSYYSKEEAKKGIFQRKTKDKIISFGKEVEAYYCSSCKKIMPVLEES